MVKERIVLGLTEKIILFNNNNNLKPNNKLNNELLIARVDTGATSSSLDIVLAKKLSLEMLDKFKIVKSASGIKRRHVVKARIKIKNKIIEDEFTLADRTHLKYSVLIGQNVLKKGNFLIDPQQGGEE